LQSFRISKREIADLTTVAWLQPVKHAPRVTDRASVCQGRHAPNKGAARGSSVLTTKSCDHGQQYWASFDLQATFQAVMAWERLS
jgi:hypothetical protein